MADNDLLGQLLGVNYKPVETPFGIGAQSLASALPSLVNPTGSTSGNLARVLGGGLLAGLLGYQARQQAAERNRALQPILTEALTAQTPAEISAIAGRPEAERISPLLQSLQLRMTDRQAKEQEQQQAFENQLKLKAVEQGIIPTGYESMFGRTGDQPLTSKQLGEADTLRKEFNKLPEVTNFGLVRTAAETVGAAVRDPSAVADQELVRRAVQLIEPGMAVREGEQAAVAASQSIPEQLKGQLSKVLEGQGSLGPKVREGIINIARRSYEANSRAYNQAKGFYETLAKDRNLPTSAISYLGEAKPFEEIINLQKVAEVKAEAPEKQVAIQGLTAELKQLQAKGKENFTAEDLQRLQSLRQQYEALKNG